MSESRAGLLLLRAAEGTSSPPVAHGKFATFLYSRRGEGCPLCQTRNFPEAWLTASSSLVSRAHRGDSSWEVLLWTSDHPWTQQAGVG